MRIIKVATLKSFWEKEPFAEQPLMSWVGTHAEYDKINVETVKYVKTTKD